MQFNKSYNLNRFYILFIYLSMLSGCTSWGDVSPAFQIDHGNEPETQDRMVRFRTTYFFRVVDSCNIDDGIDADSYHNAFGVFRVRKQGKLKIVNDSLYRFRMTGKANALYSTIHFESGVLREEQIDPFGSTVKYNHETKSFRVQSSSQIRETTRRDAILDEIKKLQALKTQLNDDHKNEINTLITAQLNLLAFENDSGSEQSRKENMLCPDGHPIIQSYFLYGPEGVRKLDPDERLLMAMTIDSKPLIGMLQQLAGKQSQFQQSQPDSFRVIVSEQEKIFDSIQKLNAVEAKLQSKDTLSKQDISNLLHELITNFER